MDETKNGYRSGKKDTHKNSGGHDCLPEFLLQDPEICGREGAAVLQPQNLRDSHEDQEMHRIECVKEIRMADISAGSVVP